MYYQFIQGKNKNDWNFRIFLDLVNVLLSTAFIPKSSLSFLNQSIIWSIVFHFSKKDTDIQITFAFKIFKIDHKLNKMYVKLRKINK